jgi:hypothetical protein
MHPFTRRRFHPESALFAMALICAATPLATCSRSVSFVSENNAAMAKMMAAMDVEPSGDADADFVAAMIPHHQGAIDMAKVELRHGRNEQLRRLAQEIIVTQQQEITVMRLAIGQPLPPRDRPSPTVSTDTQPTPHQMPHRSMRMPREE